MLLSGTMILTVTGLIQRALGFAGAAVAARIAGAADFGGYSAAVSSAAVIASYLGLGVGMVGNRFSGNPQGAGVSPQTFGTVFALLGACLAGASVLVQFAVGPWITSAVTDSMSLGSGVRTASWLSGVLILYESRQGFLVGRLQYRRVAVQGVVLGVGQCALLPLTAHSGFHAMLLAQTGATAAAVAASFWPSKLESRDTAGRRDEETWAVRLAAARRMLAFGVAQVMNGLGVAVASWLVTMLIVKADGTLVASGQYGVGNQLRNLVATVPGALSGVSLSLLAQTAGKRAETRQMINVACAVGSFLVVGVGGILLAFLPQVLDFYGSSYRDATLALSLMIGAVMIQMAGAPIAHGLTVAALNRSIVVNVAGTGTLAATALLSVPKYGLMGAAASWAVAQAIATALMLAAGRSPGTSTRLGAVMTLLAGLPMLVAIGCHGLATHLGVSRPTTTVTIVAATMGLLTLQVGLATRTGTLPAGTPRRLWDRVAATMNSGRGT